MLNALKWKSSLNKFSKFILLFSLLTFLGCTKMVPLEVIKGDLVLNGRTDLMDLSYKGDLQTFEKTLRSANNVNAKNQVNNLMTALHYAVLGGSEEKVKQLLESGADPNAMTDLLWTPLHYAVLKGDKNIMNMLLNNGADVNAEDYRHNNALYYAIYYGKFQVTEILLSAGSRINPVEDSPANLCITADSYRALAMFLGNNNQKDMSLENYRLAMKYYDASKKQCDSIIIKTKLKEIGAMFLLALAASASNYASEIDAQQRALDMAKINALSSPTGVGHGFAFYTQISPNLTTVDSSYDQIISSHKILRDYCKKASLECKVISEPSNGGLK
jgi:ankyrin repeat protein